MILAWPANSIAERGWMLHTTGKDTPNPTTVEKRLLTLLQSSEKLCGL